MHKVACLLVGLWLLYFPACLFATPANLRSLETYLGPHKGKSFSCAACHMPDAPGTRYSLDDVDKPHNPFGDRLKKVKRELSKAGKPNDMEARLQAVAQEDTDADGVANLVELLLGSDPGEKASKPDEKQFKEASARLLEFAKFQARYRWKPFEPVVRPTVPDAVTRSTNPIDAFVQAELANQNLRSMPAASEEVLVRRVYLDLVGLPPTVKEREEYLRDTSSGKYERMVEKLLADPRYAQRWGRHWMDVWRYSDWAGFGAEVRESQPHVWRWRDWIVDSIEADKGYDRMVLEMLAGDELAPEDTQTVRATGFLVRQWYKFNRNVWLDQAVEHTSKAFLGLTMNCARCHDHMYDPIKQKDYYSFRAFFEPYQIRTDRVPGQADTNLDGLARVYDADVSAKTYLFFRGNEALADKEQPCEPALPVSLYKEKLQLASVALPADAFTPSQRLFILEEAVKVATDRLQAAKEQEKKARIPLLASIPQLNGPWIRLVALTRQHPIQLQHQAAEAEVIIAQLQLLQAQAALEQRKTNQQPTLTSAQQHQSIERQKKLAEARKNLLLVQVQQGQATSKNRKLIDDQVKVAEQNFKTQQDALLMPLSETIPAATSFPSTSSGRRSALARWIASKENPLTARVAVNHIWMRHFGQPLVNTVFDFGKNGQAPTHPALLDWLASEFMTQGWSMKKLHKLILLSETYKRDSLTDKHSEQLDPDNKYYWRRLPLRMEAEAVRDSLLHISRQLDTSRGGPELDQDKGLNTFRRSMYYRHANEKQMVFLTTFDAAGPTECYRRVHSVIPQQALALANSSMAQQAAGVIVSNLQKELGPQVTSEYFVEQLFLAMIARKPTTQESAACSEFLQKQEGTLLVAGQSKTLLTRQAYSSLALVLINHHEFVTIR